MDVRKPIAGAYGKDSVWWLNHEKGKVVIDGPGLEGMAELVLDGMRVEKKPAKVLEADWGKDDNYSKEWEMELLKYAGRDAFLTYEMAAKCIQKSGLPLEDGSSDRGLIN